MSDLVGNPKDRFSHNEAQLLLTMSKQYFCCGFLFIVINSISVIRGIKHDFPFINIPKVPREVLKTEGEA